MSITSAAASSATTYPIPSITSYTNLGPLSTTITFPPNCQSDVYDFSTDGIGVPWTYYTQGCALSSCCPSSHVYSTAFEWYSNYFSPAVCPYGYTPGPADPIISTASEETVRFCCPTLFGTHSADAVPTVATAPYYNDFCQREYYNLSSTAYVYDNVFDQKSLTTEDINSWYYAAYPIQIRWKSGDFDSTTAATATSSTSSLISPASSASSLSPTASAGSSTHTLSTGVVAAVAVIVAILVIAGSAVMVWWIRKRSKKQAAKRIATENQRANEMQQNQFYKDSHPLNEVPGDTRYNHELEASERAELESQSMNGVAELN